MEIPSEGGPSHGKKRIIVIRIILIINREDVVSRMDVLKLLVPPSASSLSFLSWQPISLSLSSHILLLNFTPFTSFLRIRYLKEKEKAVFYRPID
jgi:hypothetical protein